MANVPEQPGGELVEPRPPEVIELVHGLVAVLELHPNRTDALTGMPLARPGKYIGYGDPRLGQR